MTTRIERMMNISENFPLDEKKVVKTASAKKVLQLMDKDVSYGDAIKKVMKSDGISREQLEKELDPFI